MKRNQYRKSASFSVVTSKGNGTTQQFDVTFYNIQSQSCALDISCIACAEKTIKHILLVLIWNPYALVANNEKQLPAQASESKVYLKLLQSRRSNDGAKARRLWERLFSVSYKSQDFVRIEQLLQKGTLLELAEVLPVEE